MSRYETRYKLGTHQPAHTAHIVCIY